MDKLPDYYQLLGVSTQASLEQIRRAHRDRSKHFHPDTTQLPLDQARLKFEQLQEAYRILSDPAQRLRYDQLQGQTRLQSRAASPFPPQPPTPSPTPRPIQTGSSAYLEPGERPLSSGELFALLLLGLTLVGCLVLAIALGLAHGEALMPIPSWQQPSDFLQPASQTQSLP